LPPFSANTASRSFTGRCVTMAHMLTDCCLATSDSSRPTIPDSLVVMAPASAADRSSEEQQRMIYRVLCISSRVLSLLNPVLSRGTFRAVAVVLHDCRLQSLLGAAGCNGSKLEHSPSSVSLGIHDGAEQPHKTGSEKTTSRTSRCD
jgi:hypothetical protein